MMILGFAGVSFMAFRHIESIRAKNYGTILSGKTDEELRNLINKDDTNA